MVTGSKLVLFFTKSIILCCIRNRKDVLEQFVVSDRRSPLAACSVYGDFAFSVHTVNNFSSVSNYQTHVCLCI